MYLLLQNILVLLVQTILVQNLLHPLLYINGKLILTCNFPELYIFNKS